MDHQTHAHDDQGLGSDGRAGGSDSSRRPAWSPPVVNRLGVAAVAGGPNPAPSENGTCFPAGS
jgi:hypothetical protein